MDLASLPFSIEPMQLSHVSAVLQIERESFSLPWPERAYRHELTRNDLAHYYVLGPRDTAPVPEPVSPWHRLWEAIRRRPTTEVREVVMGYGGFWLMYDEAHISTLAVRAAWRRQGLGELLLITLLDEARRLGASRATLEVRVSNTAAQALYTKYGFEQAGRRKAYYQDNREDALILTTPDFTSTAHQDLLNALRRQLFHHLAQTSLDKFLQMH
jgi:ribosomal-protein-alanine N-acetyltransferase